MIPVYLASAALLALALMIVIEVLRLRAGSRTKVRVQRRPRNLGRRLAERVFK